MLLGIIHCLLDLRWNIKDVFHCYKRTFNIKLQQGNVVYLFFSVPGYNRCPEAVDNKSFRAHHGCPYDPLSADIRHTRKSRCGKDASDTRHQSSR